jgi:hypothetical protein
MKARGVPRAGNVAITFEVCLETWVRFVREAEGFGHPDTLDYLIGVLNTALLEHEPMSMGDPNWEPPDDDVEEWEKDGPPADAENLRDEDDRIPF